MTVTIFNEHRNGLDFAVGVIACSWEWWWEWLKYERLEKGERGARMEEMEKWKTTKWRNGKGKYNMNDMKEWFGEMGARMGYRGSKKAAVEIEIRSESVSVSFHLDTIGTPCKICIETLTKGHCNNWYNVTMLHVDTNFTQHVVGSMMLTCGLLGGSQHSPQGHILYDFKHNNECSCDDIRWYLNIAEAQKSFIICDPCYGAHMSIWVKIK